MKLKEKLAWDSEHDCADPYVCEWGDGFVAGFETAREMAKQFHNSKRVNDCFTDSEDFLKLGEEEVD